MTPSLLLVGGTPGLADQLRTALPEDYELIRMTDPASRALEPGLRFRAVLLPWDGSQSVQHGLKSLRAARQVAEMAPVIVLDAASPKSPPSAVASEADHVVSWPADAEKLPDVLKDVSRPVSDLAGLCGSLPNRTLHGRTRSVLTFTPSMFDTLEELKVAAVHDCTILLIGETGCGKTYLARLIHEISHRHAERLVTVACGALPQTLIVSELFGHVQGAFTGAERDKPGKFAAAGKGSLLLDEIDVLAPDQQAKLLRVLETGEYEPVGSNDTQTSQARLIVASNVDLDQLVAEGRFRSDLYYRLNILKFHLLPLRERPDDIEFLARNFALVHSRQHGVEIRDVAAEFIAALRGYDWPGNIRELENVIRRAVLYCTTGVLTIADLPGAMRHLGDRVGAAAGRPDDKSMTLEGRIGVAEQRIIEECLAKNGQRRQATASALGISRVTLYNKMKKFGMLNVSK